jgi:hypothetical protein
MSTPAARAWRTAIVLDVSITLTAVAMFALLPPSTLNNYERAIITSATFAGVGVIFHAFLRGRVPGVRWSYLLASVTCMGAMLVYEWRTWCSDIPLSVRVPFGLFLLAGAASAGAAHVIDGGPVPRRAGHG